MQDFIDFTLQMSSLSKEDKFLKKNYRTHFLNVLVLKVYFFKSCGVSHQSGANNFL